MAETGKRGAIILLGAPGAGKGTQGRKLSERLRLPAISTGDILREAVRTGTDLGKRVQEFLNSGGLVPDEVVNETVSLRLHQPDCARGFILDGFPRTVGQAEFLEREYAGEGLEFLAVGIGVSDRTLLRRLTGRLSCPDCGKVFHREANPSGKGDRCDACGAGLVVRRDDTPEVVQERLQIYHQSTRPLIEHYRRSGAYVEVDGEGSVEEICRQIAEVVTSRNQADAAG